MKKSTALLWLLLALIPAMTYAQQPFAFKNGKFKIAQFTDLHWTPQSDKCAETEATIRAVLATEKPDIAILSGDVVTEDPADEGWKAVVRIFEDTKTPFVVTMGNHDAEHMDKDDIYDFLMKSPCYAGNKGPEDIMGVGNCVIPVYGSQKAGTVAALLYCMDSNDYQPNKLYGAYDWIHFDQIAWYREQSARFTQANNGKPLPALAFFHIPLLEYNELAGDGKTFGNDREGGVASADLNSGMFAAVADMGDVMGIFAGHDHTYTVTKSGREATYYYPSGLNSEEEQNAQYSPAVNASSPKLGVAYTYYEGKCKRVAQIASCTKVKEGVMPNFSIEEAAVTDHFAYDFRTLIKIPEKGVYRFYTFSDDGSVLYIDGKEVVNNDGGHSARRAEGKIALEKGFHELRVLYFEDYMGQELEIGFSGRDIPETPIPDYMLFIDPK